MQDRRNADIRMVTRVVQGLVDTLSELNGWAPSTFVMADDTGLELERAERDKILVEMGGIKLTKEYFLDRYDFVEGDFEIAETPQPLIAPPQDDAPDEVAGETASAELSARMALPKRFTPQQEAIERGADRLIAKVSDPIPADALLSAVKAATDPADLAVRLSLLIDEADPRFTEFLARAQFAAQTLGYVVAATDGEG